MKDKKFLYDLRLKSVKELEAELQKARQEVFEARMEAAQGKLKNVEKTGQLRRRVAQILTVIKEKTKDAEK